MCVTTHDELYHYRQHGVGVLGISFNLGLQLKEQDHRLLELRKWQADWSVGLPVCLSAAKIKASKVGFVCGCFYCHQLIYTKVDTAKQNFKFLAKIF